MSSILRRPTQPRHRFQETQPVTGAGEYAWEIAYKKVGDRGSFLVSATGYGWWFRHFRIALAAECLPGDLQRSSDRAPPARRFASRLAPTFVATCHGLLDLGCQPLVLGDASRGDGWVPRETASYKPGGQPWPVRHRYVATNVGASLLAMRRAGGARSQERYKNQDRHLAALMRSLGRRPSATPRFRCRYSPLTNSRASWLCRSSTRGRSTVVIRPSCTTTRPLITLVSTWVGVQNTSAARGSCRPPA